MEKDKIKNLIIEILEKATMPAANISHEEDAANTWFLVETNEPHLLTGRDGEGLHALNFLVRKIIEKNLPTSPEGEEEETGFKFMIDVNGFQKKRIENIRAIAHMMAERARYFKSSIEVDPMSSFERRIIHEFLANATDLKTESEGMGRSRRVVIKYIGGI